MLDSFPDKTAVFLVDRCPINKNHDSPIIPQQSSVIFLVQYLLTSISQKKF